MATLAQIEEHVREAYTLGVDNRADLRAHIATCEETGKRTEEKIDAMNDKLDLRFNHLADSFKEWREAEREERLERQQRVDAAIAAIHERNRRVAIAVLTACITFVGLMLGSVFKPFAVGIGEFLRSLL